MKWFKDNREVSIKDFIIKDEHIQPEPVQMPVLSGYRVLTAKGKEVREFEWSSQ